ncbi:MAG: hypothetical protein N4A50_11615 [Vallitalea sp.]|jgi:hypothetical protein|nr:hypothetical protein [Vallitalea sp.]
MRRKGYLIIISCLLLVIICQLYTSANANSVNPGTIGDPIVTKSYVDEQMEILKNIISQQQSNTQTNNNVNNEIKDVDMASIYAYIDAYIQSSLTGVNEESKSTSTQKFEILNLDVGAKLICSESTEVILRSGTATAIANEAGIGISDLTGGKDLGMGVAIPKNHLLLIPRNDGRGILIKEKAWIMVKGEHTVK